MKIGTRRLAKLPDGHTAQGAQKAGGIGDESGLTRLAAMGNGAQKRGVSFDE
jgi:streptogramin lyase